MRRLHKLFYSSAVYSRKLPRCSLSHQLCRRLSTIELPPDLKRVREKFSIPEGIMGQPTWRTHPHLIPEGHLTCGITQAEYHQRRETLMAKLIKESENPNQSHIVVIPAACKQYMTDKIPYVFRQNSDYFYLTGSLEPEAILVMVKPSNTDKFKTVMFVHEKDSHAELWEGPRTGCTAAAQLFAVDETAPLEEFSKFIHKTTSDSKPTLLWYNNESVINPAALAAITPLLRDGAVYLRDPQLSLHVMRSVKSDAEVELMKETCYIGAQTLNMAMACTKPGISESAIVAVLELGCRRGGAEQLAFPPVVAGGARATHIHYIANDQLLHERELLLVDAGSQRSLYNSDLSRSWPVGGRFSPHQRILYEIVLEVQKSLIDILDQRRPPLDQLFEAMCQLLGQYLQQEGILKKDLSGNDLMARAYRLCPHHVSHYLGLDVHDTPRVRRSAPLADNMLLTVEPGIYIRADDTSVPAEFRGAGVRVEDDVLLAGGGARVLTAAAVKEPADIEALVGTGAL